jgi:hypothetical protein
MTRVLTAKHILRYGSILLLFIAICGYGIWQSRDLLFGIRLKIYGVASGQSFTGSILPLSGVAKHAVRITLDGADVPVADDGTWKDTVLLEPGYNTITITATDKFKKVITKEFVVYYKTPPAPIKIEPPEEPPSIPATSATSSKVSDIITPLQN